MRRVGLLLAVAACLLLAAERPVAAHGGGGVEATNFETTLGGVEPALAGVSVRLLDAGTRLELRNEGPDVVVLGHDGQPYLRVGSGGAFENRNSAAAALGSHGAGPPATRGGDQQAPPDWRKLSARPVARWDHHRTHLLRSGTPPEVEARPDERHVVLPRWEIELRRGEERAVAVGTLTWVPSPSPAPWFGLMGAAFLGVAALGLLRRWGPALATATAVVVAVDVVHAVSVASSSPGGLGSHLGRVVTGNFYGIMGWALAAVAIHLLRRSRVDGLYAGVFAGLSIAAFGGLLDLATLSRSVTPFALPVEVARLCVAIAAGAGLGLAAACLLVIQRTPEARRVVGAADDGGTRETRQEGDDPATGDVLGVGGRSSSPG